MAFSSAGLISLLCATCTECSDRRIDWILYRGSWRVLETETVTRSRDGRYPSDHFPVLATFEISAL